MLMSPPCVLVIDAGTFDATALEEALAEEGREALVHVVRSALAAAAHLRRSGPAINAELPTLILCALPLDAGGRNILTYAKGDPALAHIPFVMLCLRHRTVDLGECLNLGANAFFTRPNLSDGWQSLSSRLAGYLGDEVVPAGAGRVRTRAIAR